MPLNEIERKELAIQVPGLADDPMLQFLAERKLLPQQNDMESFQNPGNPLTSIRRSIGLYYPREKTLINRQEKALEEYDMDLKAKKALEAEVTKLALVGKLKEQAAASMAPQSLTQLLTTAPAIAQTIAPLETQPAAIDPKAITALDQSIAGINVADVINPNVISRPDVDLMQQTGTGIIDRPLRPDERIRAGSLLEQQASGAIVAPGQAIDPTAVVTQRMAGEAALGREQTQAGTELVKTMLTLQKPNEAQLKQQERLLLERELYEVNNKLSDYQGLITPEVLKMNPTLQALTQRKSDIRVALGYDEKHKQPSPKEAKTPLELVSQPVRDELLAKGLSNPTPDQINQAVRDNLLTETGTQEVKGEMAAMGVDPRQAKMREWQRARERVFDRQLKLVREQGQIALENKPIDATTQEAIAALRGVQGQVEQFRQKYTPQEMDRYLGLLDRPLQEAAQYLRADKRFADFDADLSALRSFMFDVGGKALTNTELSVLKGFIPDGWEPNSTKFMSKLEALSTKSAAMEREKLKIANTKRGDIGTSSAKVKAALKNLEDVLANP